MRLWLRRDSQAAPVDRCKDFVAAAAEESIADRAAELFGIIDVAVARFAQELRAVGIGDDGFKMQLAVTHFSESADGDLAASAEPIEQRSFAGGGGTGCGIVQEGKM